MFREITTKYPKVLVIMVDEVPFKRSILQIQPAQTNKVGLCSST